MVPAAALPLLMVLGGPPAPATGYTFLGALESFDRVEAGVQLVCAPGARLTVRFVAAGVVRVTLERPGEDEPLLEEALVPAAERAGEASIDIHVEEAGDQLVLRGPEVDVVVRTAPCRLSVRTKDGAVIQEDDPAFGTGWDGDEVRAWKALAPGERFFGLGEKTGDLDKRGRRWEMWNTDDFAYEVDADPLYQSIPFYVGLRDGRAYGLFLNNSHRSVFSLGAGNDRYASFAAAGGRLDYFVVNGPAVARVVERYAALTGRPPLPPAWALGYQQSRWSYTPQAEILRLARTFREKQVPADVLYLDIHHLDGYRVFTWDRERFPDPEAMLRELDGMGFRVVTIVDPGVKADPEYAVARQGLDGGHFLRWPDATVYVGSVWPGPSYFPDFSRSATRAWWGEWLADWMDQGVDGVWNDMNEPAVWGGTIPEEVLMEDGGRDSDQKRMHNLYGLLMARGTIEALREHRPDERPFVLTRAGFAGIQRYAAVWTGDNVASAEHLELSIRMMLGLGLSGVAFTGADVGGFQGTPSPELFARWMQVGALSPLFRTHTVFGSADQEPWSFGEEIERVNREAIELRYRLLPYLYTLFREAHMTGWPILRPLFFHHQADPAAYDRRWQHQLLVGERLLAAPVTREGERVKEVYLPRGEWLDLATGSVHEGGRTTFVEAPLDRLPLFLGAGGILPIQDVVQHVEPGPTGGLTLEVFAGPERGAFVFYEDDGASNDYESGEYRTTRFEVVRSNAALTLTRAIEHDGFQVPARTVEVRFRGVTDVPTAVTTDDRPLARIEAGATGEGWRLDREATALVVRFSESGLRQTIHVRVREAAEPR